MLTFLQFLSESKKSDARGKMHENLVHYFLNGGRHASSEHEKEHDTLRERVGREISGGEYNHAVGRAKHAADYIRNNIAAGREISHIERTSKPGEVGESQSDNPSDIVIHFKDGSKHGISLKVSNKKNANVPVSNPGAGTIQKLTGVDTLSRNTKIVNALQKRFPEMSGLSADKRKELIRSNPHIQKIVKQVSDLYLKNSARKQADGIGKMSPEEKAKFIKTEVLRGSSSFPVSMMTSGGENDDYTTQHKDPSKDFEHILKDPHKINHRVSGNSIIFSHSDHGDFGSLRYKYESQPLASSIKTAGALKPPKKKTTKPQVNPNNIQATPGPNPYL